MSKYIIDTFQADCVFGVSRLETVNSANLMPFEFISMVDYCNQAVYAADDLAKKRKKKVKQYEPPLWEFDKTNRM